MKYNKINLKTPCFMRLSPFVFIIPYGHTTASILVKKGFDIKSIQMWLRHANVKTTLNIYAHVGEDAKQVMAKDISNMLSASTDNNTH